MTGAGAAGAIGVALAAGIGVVSLAWPRHAPLPWLACLALASLLGPCAIGLGLLLCGMCGLPTTMSVPLLTMAGLAVAAAGVRRRAARPRAAPVSSRGAVIAIVLLAGAWAGWISARTHLGWDGTLVWYQKARIIAASGGAMPAAAVADLTRKWSAPDYPLHVPLAMAWVRLWLPVEDERAMKILPALWAAAVFALVAAAVLERTHAERQRSWRAACAVLVLASAPRLLVGEGSLTSGYADGPMAALLAATVWMAWMSRWGADRRFMPLLAASATALAWTKQEGTIAVLVIAIACASHGRQWRRSAFALPALGLAAAWQAWAMTQGAPAGMAYAWPGTREAAGRLGSIARAYVAEMLDPGTWGLFWPGLFAMLGVTGNGGKRLPLAILMGVILCGAMAFTTSTWPDLGSHLRVTVPRQLVQVAPLLVIIAFSMPAPGASRPIR